MSRASSAPLSTVSVMNMTSSPIILTTRPPWAEVRSKAMVSNWPTTSASWCSGSSWVWAVKPTRSAKPTQTISPSSVVARTMRRRAAAPRWRRHTSSMICGMSGSTSATCRATSASTSSSVPAARSAAS